MASFTHAFVVICAIQGAMGGVILGWLHHGLLGAVLGIPIGVVAGVLGFWVLILAIGGLVFVGLCAWAVYRRGPRGLVLLYRHGADGVARGGPMRGPDEPAGGRQSNDAGD